MQKQRCHEFAAERGWNIAREFSEKGVSGFKVSAKDRDAIQEIQKDAAQKKFDVLLVFMFDRLGRKEDKIPFVVEWFVQNGIEVWSAEEGQQRFDNRLVRKPKDSMLKVINTANQRSSQAKFFLRFL